MRSPDSPARARHDGAMTGRADAAIFAVLFATIGTVILVNQPPRSPAFILACVVVAYAACAVFAFRAIVCKR